MRLAATKRLWWLCPGLALAACLADRETTLSRSKWAREAAALRDERERAQRELAVLRATEGETTRAIVAANQQSVQASADLRAVQADLRHRLAALVRAEQDLAAARSRAAQIEVELAPLRALEAALRELAHQEAVAQQRLAALQAEVAATVAEAARQEAELRPRLELARQRLLAIQQAGQSLAAAEAAIGSALGQLAPPPLAPTPPPGPKK